MYIVHQWTWMDHPWYPPYCWDSRKEVTLNILPSDLWRAPSAPGEMSTELAWMDHCFCWWLVYLAILTIKNQLKLTKNIVLSHLSYVWHVWWKYPMLNYCSSASHCCPRSGWTTRTAQIFSKVSYGCRTLLPRPLTMNLTKSFLFVILHLRNHIMIMWWARDTV